MKLTRDRWIKMHGEDGLLGMMVIPCVDCTDSVCHGWKVLNLSTADRDGILSRFIHRDTLESPYNSVARALVHRNHYTPPTDRQWIDARIWGTNTNGDLDIVG